MKSTLWRKTTPYLAMVTVVGLSASATAQDSPPAETPPAEQAEKPEGAEEAPPAEAAPQAPAEKPPAVTNEADMTPEQRAAYDGHLRAGKSAYAKQDFDTAFNELNAAYSIFNKASILFNLALISEKGGALERARDYYARYLEAPGVTLENRRRASERLAAVQEILATSSSADEARAKSQVTDLLPALEAMGIESVPEEGSGDTTATAQTSDTGTDTTADTSSDSTSADAGDSMETKPVNVKYKWPVYAAFGASAASLIGGVVMVAMTNKRIDEGKQAALDGDLAEHAAAEEDASASATAAAGLFAGGAALAIVGSYFVVRNSQAAEAEAAAADGGDSKPKASLGMSLHKNFLGPILSVKF